MRGRQTDTSQGLNRSVPHVDVAVVEGRMDGEARPVGRSVGRARNQTESTHSCVTLVTSHQAVPCVGQLIGSHLNST